MHPLVEHILYQWSEQLTDHFSYQIGLSGGIDSVVLLHIFSQIKNLDNDLLHTPIQPLPICILEKTLQLNAIHVNHGISKNATFWEQFCHDYCQSLSIDLKTIQHQVTKSGGESLENNARKIRYQEFTKSNAQVIILAHHQNDQVETTLSQIFRGSDLHNIASMRKLSQRQNKLIWRPLLDIPRKQIEEYAKQYNLKYIDDESNLDTSYLRNFIRHDVLPELANFDSNMPQKILKLPEQLQEILSLVDEIANDDLTRVIQNNTQAKIEIDKLRQLSNNRQQNVLIYYLKQQNMPLPTDKQITEFLRQALTSEWDKEPKLKLDTTNHLVKLKQFIFINKIQT